jgi:hypothetical protein
MPASIAVDKINTWAMDIFPSDLFYNSTSDTILIQGTFKTFQLQKNAILFRSLEHTTVRDEVSRK